MENLNAMDNLSECEINWMEDQIILSENDKLNSIIDDLVINLNEKVDNLNEKIDNLSQKNNDLENCIKILTKSDRTIESKFDKINYKNGKLNEENTFNLKDIILKNEKNDLKFQKIIKIFYLIVFFQVINFIMFSFENKKIK